MSYSDLILQVAFESGQLDAEDMNAGAEEITIITDETTTELEESMADCAEKVERLNESNAGADKLLAAAESMEAYKVSLGRMRELGQPLTGESVRQWAMSVSESFEGRDIPSQFFLSDIMGTISSMESDSAADYSKEAEEKTGNIAQRAWATLKQLFDKLITFVREYIASFGQSAKAIEAGGQRLVRLGRVLKSKKEGAKKISASKYPLLAVDGKLSASGALDVASTAQAEVGNVVQELATAISSTQGGSLDKVLSATKKEIALTGGKKIVYSISEAGSSPTIKVEGEGKAAEGEVDALTPSEIGSLGTKLVDFARKTADSTKKLSGTLDKLETAVKRTAGDIKAGADYTSEELADLRKHVKAAMSASAAIRKLPATVSTTTLGIAKQAYKFGNASAAQYSDKAAAAAEPEKKDDKKDDDKK